MMPRFTISAGLSLLLASAVSTATWASPQTTSGVIDAPPSSLTKKGTDTVDSTLSVVNLGTATTDSVLTLTKPTCSSCTTNGTTSGNPVTPPVVSTSYVWQIIASEAYGAPAGEGQQYYTCAWIPPGFADIGNNFNPGTCASGNTGQRYYCSTFVPTTHDDLQDDTYECQAH
jgi:hypothetical protein